VKQITKNNAFVLLVLALSLSMMGMGAVGLVTHAQSSGTVIAITPSGGATFSNTGWTPQSYTVDTSSIANSQNIYIQVQGTTTGDPYPRFLVVSVNGQVVNSQPNGEGSFGDGIGAYYTDVVEGSFNVQYPVTSAVSGQSTSTVLIGLTTWEGSWNVQANFVGQSSGNQNVSIPAGSSNATIPLSELLGGLGILSLIGAVLVHEKSER
jgi:hypothetical protein